MLACIGCKQKKLKVRRLELKMRPARDRHANIRSAMAKAHDVKTVRGVVGVCF